MHAEFHFPLGYRPLQQHVIYLLMSATPARHSALEELLFSFFWLLAHNSNSHLGLLYSKPCDEILDPCICKTENLSSVLLC